MLMFSTWRRGVALAELLALVVLCAGCGSVEEVPRVAMYGNVSLNGSPLENGSISLLPAAGNEAPSANTTIQQGAYRFNTENGPVAGSYRVLVMHSVGAAAGSTPVSKIPGPKSAAPPPLKREWNLKVDVPAVGDFEHNIELQ